MSILLDAVTRNKQQQSSPLPDPVLTPRANYPAPRKSSSFPVAKLSLLAGAVALGIGAAWGVSNLRQLQSSVIASVAEMPVEAPSAALAHSPSQGQVEMLTASQSAVVASEVMMPSQALTENSGVRLAGKVALPRAQTLNEVPVAVAANGQVFALNNATYLGDNPAINSDNTAPNPTSVTTDPSYDDYLATSAALAQTTREQATTAQEGAEPYLEPQDDQPVMLGANANRQGLASLEALRQQVNVAAADVGLETSQSRQDDKLVATFQDALKDVEYTKAANTPVTKPQLDPIPKPQGDDVLKYGQLPAGLQLQVPEFNIVAHVYSTAADQRWLNVDGAELQEGDKIGGKLTIVAIRPQDVVLEIQGTRFKVPAI